MRKNINSVVFLVFCLITILLLPNQIRAEEGRAISKDGVPISFSVYGEGEPTLVFIHGWGSNRSIWQKQIPYFEKEFRIVTLDLAGYGKSGPRENIYSPEAFAEDVVAVIREIHASKVILIGHGISGAVIMKVADMLPDYVIGLVGIDTMHDFEAVYTPELIEDTLEPFKRDYSKAAGLYARLLFVKGADPELVDGVAKMMSGTSAKAGISTIGEMMKISNVANLPKTEVPVWFINSDLSPTNTEINRKYIPESYFRIIPGVGHFLMLESPDKFNRQLDNIINEIQLDNRVKEVIEEN